MQLTSQESARLYRAFRRSDPSLDTRVLVAVRTTGIYCLPSCRARKPKRENVRFYFTRAEAERDGFRACRRCRPEVHGGRQGLEQAAVRRWLRELVASDSGIERLARSNGSSPSGLYRMFRRHLGHGPRRARNEARLRSACELLGTSRRSITEVAYEAGFGSLATFYRWFRRSFGVTPKDFRHLAARADQGKTRSEFGNARCFCVKERTMKPLQTREIATTTLATPIGRLMISASPRGLLRIDFAARAASQTSARNFTGSTAPPARQARRHLAAAIGQLREYFAGERSAFDLPLDLAGTAYQHRVWRALLRIPFGRTLSYGELAARLGEAGGARAVGRACATNPAPVVVPCHRVIGRDGGLHGYDGGLWRKQRLLELERANSSRSLRNP